MKQRSICIALTVFVFASHAAAQSPMRTISKDVGIDQHLGSQAPLDLTCRDEQGNKVHLRDFIGDKPVILACVYYRCPMLCNEVLNGLLRSSQAMRLQLEKDYRIITVSIDPRETPAMAAAKKQNYVRKYRRAGAEKGWRFLTADEATVSALTRTVGFRYRYDQETDQFAHASGIMVLTPQGKISHYFYGIEFPPDDLRLALVESSENRIGDLVDQVLLLCFHYNPSTGRYGLAISAVLKLASLTLVAIGGVYLLRMFRLERRRLMEAKAAI